MRRLDVSASAFDEESDHELRVQHHERACQVGCHKVLIADAFTGSFCLIQSGAASGLEERRNVGILFSVGEDALEAHHIQVSVFTQVQRVQSVHHCPLHAYIEDAKALGGLGLRVDAFGEAIYGHVVQVFDLFAKYLEGISRHEETLSAFDSSSDLVLVWFQVLHGHDLVVFSHGAHVHQIHIALCQEGRFGVKVSADYLAAGGGGHDILDVCQISKEIGYLGIEYFYFHDLTSSPSVGSAGTSGASCSTGAGSFVFSFSIAAKALACLLPRAKDPGSAP